MKKDSAGGKRFPWHWPSVWPCRARHWPPEPGPVEKVTVQGYQKPTPLSFMAFTHSDSEVTVTVKNDAKLKREWRTGTGGFTHAGRPVVQAARSRGNTQGLPWR